MDVNELIEAIDINKDGALNYTEWCRAITPKDMRYKPPPVRESTLLTKTEKSIRSFNWKTEMKNMLQIYSKAEDFNDQLKYACHVNGNEIYDEIDKPLNGYITITQIAAYLRTECGYHLTEEDQKLILNRYDRDKDFEISRDEFNYMVDFVEMDPLTEPDALSYRSGGFVRQPSTQQLMQNRPLSGSTRVGDQLTSTPNQYANNPYSPANQPLTQSQVQPKPIIQPQKPVTQPVAQP